MALFGKTHTIRLDIEGMTCGHCVQTVTKALEGVKGVKTAHVDLEAQRAEVEVRGDPDPAALEAAVAEAGYTARPAA